MSNEIYPTLPGLTFGVQRNLRAAPVTVKTTPSQREYRARDATLPRYRYVLGYEFLRADAVLAELQALVGFFGRHGGSFDDFLFLDPDDNAAALQTIGIGDGSTTAYQLLRSLGNFAEPVFDPIGTPALHVVDSWREWDMTTFTHRNLLVRSEEFDNASWSKTATVTANSLTAPDGTLTADTLTDASAAVASNVYQSAAIVNGTSHQVFSVYIAKTTGGTSNTVRLTMIYSGGSGITATAYFNTDSGVVLSHTGTSALVADAGDFWRVSVTEQNDASGNTSVQCVLTPAHAPHGSTAGDVTLTGSCVAWGAQLDTGWGAPTPYLKTTSAVTPSGGDFTLPGNGVVALKLPLAVGSALQWTGSFYRRCRFLYDELDLTKFMQDLWEAKKVELLSTKP